MIAADPTRVAREGRGGVQLDAPALSVIIPTHRRLDTLPRVLDEVLAQAATVAGGAEVWVCDDASGDGTDEALARVAAKASTPFGWLSFARNHGPACARNAAMARARGAALLLLGDDTVPAPGLLARHAAHHAAHPEETSALLGFCSWPGELAADPFLAWLEQGGRRYFFDYRDLPDGGVVSGMFFYTCNVSFKRALVTRAGGFDESFPFASHEDLELGMRLERAGMRLVFDRGARVEHWHRLTLDGTVRRIYRMGYSSVNFWKRVPDSSGVAKRLARSFLTAAAGTPFARCAVRRASTGAWSPPSACWLRVLDLAYWCGAADGRRGRVDKQLSGGAR